MKRIFLLLLPALLGLAGAGDRVAPVVDTARLDSLFDLLENNRLMMGAVTVSYHDQPVYHRVLGNARMDSGNVRAATNTKYRIGSVSKMFTSVIVQQLIEEGKLQYSTKLSSFFPELPHANAITVEQLLQHHSGLPHFHRNSELVHLWNCRNETEVLQLAGAQAYCPDDVKNGAYSNLNFILLGFIVGKVTHTSYEEQLRNRITVPIGLSHTKYEPGCCSSSDNEAAAFEISGNRWQPVEEREWKFTEASGLLVSTTNDLTHFISALFDGKLLKKESLAKMCALQDGFGLGIEEMPFYEKKGFGHSGRINGFLSELVHFPQDGWSVALTVNGHVYPMNDIMIGVLSILYHKPYALPEVTPVELPKEQLQALTGNYFAPDLGCDVHVFIRGEQLVLQTPRDVFGTMTFSPVSAEQSWSVEDGALLELHKNGSPFAKNGRLVIHGAEIPLVRN